MNNNKREANEKGFDIWVDNQEGGITYSFEIVGKSGWKAKYLKQVDSNEVTFKFWQEIYDDKNILREVHEKNPVDTGHKTI